MRQLVSLSTASVPALALGLLIGASLSSCTAYSAYYPFQPFDKPNVATAPPPGVRFAAHFHGVLKVPTEGIPARQYELTIQVEQASGPEIPIWEPVELKNTRVIDDEGQEFQATAVLVSEDPDRSGRAAGRAKTKSRHYLVVYELTQAYRFESIGRAEVSWKLRAAGHPPLTIDSTFLR